MQIIYLLFNSPIVLSYLNEIKTWFLLKVATRVLSAILLILYRINNIRDPQYHNLKGIALSLLESLRRLHQN